MLFSSNIFLYLFFPMVLIGYGVLCGIEKLFRVKVISLKNLFLLLVSQVFYLFGGGRLILLLLLIVAVNYIAALLMERGNRKLWMTLTATINIGLLAWFKYLGFILENLSALYVMTTGNTGFADVIKVTLPIGISFYVFQALSYTIDVYRGKVQVQRNFFKLLMYISLFPQLIAGPIVRYEHVMNEMDSRRETFSGVYLGACRFCIGLAKKVMIADLVGKAVDSIFSTGVTELSTVAAWMGIGLYTLQIYYDFSGYSDMAIGMAKIFGFNFRENFNLPYTAKNITEFWSRWHISLSSFLKDYLYIPLGGNRVKESRIYLNLLIVFAVCGLWHGAAWTFVVWGIYHGVLRATERYLKVKHNFVMSGWWGQLITILLVMVGWVMFRCSTVSDAFLFLGALLGLNGGDGFVYYQPGYYVNGQVLLVSLLGMAGALIPFARIKETWRGTLIHGVYAVFCLVISMIYLSDATFNPFIYFQF